MAFTGLVHTASPQQSPLSVWEEKKKKASPPGSSVNELLTVHGCKFSTQLGIERRAAFTGTSLIWNDVCDLHKHSVGAHPLAR